MVNRIDAFSQDLTPSLRILLSYRRRRIPLLNTNSRVVALDLVDYRRRKPKGLVDGSQRDRHSRRFVHGGPAPALEDISTFTIPPSEPLLHILTIFLPAYALGPLLVGPAPFLSLISAAAVPARDGSANGGLFLCRAIASHLLYLLSPLLGPARPNRRCFHHRKHELALDLLGLISSTYHRLKRGNNNVVSAPEFRASDDSMCYLADWIFVVWMDARNAPALDSSLRWCLPRGYGALRGRSQLAEMQRLRRTRTSIVLGIDKYIIQLEGVF